MLIHKVIVVTDELDEFLTVCLFNASVLSSVAWILLYFAVHNNVMLMLSIGYLLLFSLIDKISKIEENVVMLVYISALIILGITNIVTLATITPLIPDAIFVMSCLLAAVEKRVFS